MCVPVIEVTASIPGKNTPVLGITLLNMGFSYMCRKFPVVLTLLCFYLTKEDKIKKTYVQPLGRNFINSHNSFKYILISVIYVFLDNTS